eukprot:CAMPEP_0172383670 /NCGR_PEP_ID=MMETSP1061-20121228/1527_1 /TAXON_ID=37318 /ORGANISM="Pseudo-nitzschia pungens, Strain cf. pungens" /LENGTH=376 /DNA_ID=CAMNT_0013111995 /DNA_START=81 /DNA_END=1211 /DNA_ORIENTATION=-
MRGAFLLHKIAEFAVFAVLAIATTTILSVVITGGAKSGPSSTVVVVVVDAFAPTCSRTPLRQHPLFHNTAATKPTRSLASTSTSTSTSASTSASTSTSTSASASTIPRLDPADLDTLKSQGYVVVENFLPPDSEWKDALRNDVLQLRQNNKFKIARIGQDSTNALNQEIRVAETCFLARDKPELRDVPNAERERLYDVLDALREDLEGIMMGGAGSKLDAGLAEFLYAYYPEGGFYRRHRDAIPGSASVLREYSLLLYLNEDSYDPDKDGGQLRIHMDSGGDFLPAGEAPLFQDVDARGGTLVLFESDKFPHEVLDTSRERFAVVGWYNRPVSLGDLAAINDSQASGGQADPLRLVGLAVAAGLVTVGLINILASS